MRFSTWVDAREYALKRAKEYKLDLAIRRVKEFGRTGYNVTFACKMDSDYTRAEIVRPTDKI